MITTEKAPAALKVHPARPASLRDMSILMPDPKSVS